MAQIICQNVSLGYENRCVAKGITFELNEGDYLCIVGENGSGKSTLMKTLLGLQAPIDGKILLGDGLKQNEIGYLPQQTQVQRDFPASVKEIVQSGCQTKVGLRPFYNKKEKLTAIKNMQLMGVDSFADKSYRKLSGGQQQRVLLARALCATKRCLVLDEPVSGLDPKVTAEMYELISKLNNRGISIIMVSHDIGAAVNYASHILHIGDENFYGTVDEYLKSPSGNLFLAKKGGEL